MTGAHATVCSTSRWTDIHIKLINGNRVPSVTFYSTIVQGGREISAIILIDDYLFYFKI